MPSVYEEISLALDRYAEAADSVDKVYVSRAAGKFGKSRGNGVEAGRRLHSRIWGFDPYDVLGYDEICTPFPLAWRFRFGWLLGVPDQLCFRRGKPYAVVEYKSYMARGLGEKIQASLYGLLAELNFTAEIEVYIRDPGGLSPIQGWRALALEGLRAAASLARRRSSPGIRSRSSSLWCKARRRGGPESSSSQSPRSRMG